MTNSLPQRRLALAAGLTILHSGFDCIQGGVPENKCKCPLTVSFIKYGVNSRPLEIACVQFNVDYLAQNACCCNKSVIRMAVVSVGDEFIRVLFLLLRSFGQTLKLHGKIISLDCAPNPGKKKKMK